MGRKSKERRSSELASKESQDPSLTLNLGKVQTEPLNVDALIEENHRLRRRLEEAERKLGEAEEINKEVSHAKELLSEEIVDLTKVLFEEANGMVANEARARSQLEMAKRKLQHELDQIQDRLKLESQQLQELKSKLASANSSNVSVVSRPSIGDESPPESTIIAVDIGSQSYFDLLFPDRRFSSRNKCNGTNGMVWKSIIGSIDLNLFDSFTKFLDIIGSLSDENFLGNPFVKKIYEADVMPCLGFECKPASFSKSLVLHFLRNDCSIEKVNVCSVLGSPIQRAHSTASHSASREVFSAYHAGTTPIDDLLASDDFSGPRADEQQPSRLLAMMSEFTLSLTSMADPTFSPGPQSPDAILRRPQPTFCALCGSKFANCLDQQLFKFKKAESEAPLLIDLPCREKLVAVAELFTFLRHLRKGLFSSRPIVDLYFEVLHYRRNIFYARTGSLSFFAQSDIDTIVRQ